MPAPYPAEFKRLAVGLAAQPDAKVAEVARDLGIAESGLPPIRLRAPETVPGRAPIGGRWGRSSGRRHPRWCPLHLSGRRCRRGTCQ